MLEMVSAAGFAPAITRFQAEHVGCYTTRWICPDRCCQGSGKRGTPTLARSRGKTSEMKNGDLECAIRRFLYCALFTSYLIRWRTRRELHPQPSRRQRGALLVELRVLSENGGKCW